MAVKKKEAVFWGKTSCFYQVRSNILGRTCCLNFDGRWNSIFFPESLKLSTRIDGDTLEDLDLPGDKAGDFAVRIRLFIPLTCTSKI